MSERVSLEDIESKLRDLGGTATAAATKATAPALGAAAVGAVLAIAAVYLLGRRRGRKEAPVLEIRRI
jgi:membrane protein DedA with SNARE-associated domain